VTLVDMGDRMRLICGELRVEDMQNEMPKLPVACALWETKPDFETGTAAWIQAGGAHHACFSMALNTQHIRDLATMLDIELLVIDDETQLSSFVEEARRSDVLYRAM